MKKGFLNIGTLAFSLTLSSSVMAQERFDCSELVEKLSEVAYHIFLEGGQGTIIRGTIPLKPESELPKEAVLCIKNGFESKFIDSKFGRMGFSFYGNKDKSSEYPFVLEMYLKEEIKMELK